MGVDSESKVPFGRKNDGRLYDVDEVENGLACDCYCPYCGVLLVAKHGEVNRHHFAHYGHQTCDYGSEAGLRLAVKEVLDRRKEIRLPSVTLRFGDNLPGVIVQPEQLVGLDEVSLVDEGTKLPDVVVRHGDRLLYVDVQVAKGMNSNRLASLQDKGTGVLQVSMAELDDTVRMNDVEQLVVDGVAAKVWLSHFKIPKWRQWLEQRTERRKAWRGRYDRVQVSQCPLPGKGRSASLHDDCHGCRYFRRFDYDDGHVLCLGSYSSAVNEAAGRHRS